MQIQFSLGSLFRWTTLVALCCVVFKRLITEKLNYDVYTSFLLPFYDILWLMNVENILEYTTIQTQTGILQQLALGIGLVCSVALHSLVLVTTYCFIFGFKENK